MAEYNESLIRSAFKKIQLYHGNKSEAKAAFMIFPAMDSISKIPPVTDQDFKTPVKQKITL